MSRINHIKLAKTLAMLQQGPLTAAKLATDAQIHLITAQRWLRALHKENAIHITGWLPDTMGRDSTPIYAIGPGTNTPRKRLSHAENMRRYRARLKQKESQ